MSTRRAEGVAFPAGPQGLLRSLNARAVLEHIHRAGPVSRGDLAAATGLSKPTVGLALQSLSAAGVLDTDSPSSGRPGPSAALYRIRPLSGLSIGLDVGHEWTYAAVADISGEMLARRKVRTRRRLTTLVRQLSDLVADLAGDLGVPASGFAHAVIGVPAVVAPSGQSLALCDVLPDNGRGFPQAIRAALPMPVTLENDVNLAALGERAVGYGRDIENFAFCSIGTGVGVGIIIGGKLYRGVSGSAGEVGYLPGDDPTVPATPPLLRAMIDSTLSGTAIVDEALAQGLPPELDGRAVFDLARAGDERATRVVDIIARRIAYVICSVLAVLDPQLVVLGGGVGLNSDLLLDPVMGHIRAMSPFEPHVEVSKSGSDAVLFGAVSMASELARDAVFAAASR
ncbi:ROK family transcriptional regulator [Jatrophihabitans telluris]|uniref:ROK family transcriptional regulator n=1 Tax=Jatrophihabitans telluris TaxID=2038343 RepID=A0ABY4QZR6_9ACTN|nr:ROK family transcriptional regulator [Jatrophihabitans telluris]UQX89060.1 ROK family transcriptional regulator [Jatrophihabitans telluris]